MQAPSRHLYTKKTKTKNTLQIYLASTTERWIRKKRLELLCLLELDVGTILDEPETLLEQHKLYLKGIKKIEQKTTIETYLWNIMFSPFLADSFHPLRSLTEDMNQYRWRHGHRFRFEAESFLEKHLPRIPTIHCIYIRCNDDGLLQQLLWIRLILRMCEKQSLHIILSTNEEEKQKEFFHEPLHSFSKQISKSIHVHLLRERWVSFLQCLKILYLEPITVEWHTSMNVPHHLQGKVDVCILDSDNPHALEIHSSLLRPNTGWMMNIYPLFDQSVCLSSLKRFSCEVSTRLEDIVFVR